MKKAVVIIVLAGLFSLRGQDARASHPATTIDVVVKLSVTSDNPPTIIGQTNLPEGTQLMGGLEGKRPDCEPSCSLRFSVAKVHGGRFQFGAVEGAQRVRPGFYEFELLAFSRGQPGEVAEIIGSRGEYLRGPLVVFLDESSHYQQATFPRPVAMTDNERMMGLMIRLTQRIAILPQGRAPSVTPSAISPRIRDGWATFEGTNGLNYLVALGSFRHFGDGSAHALVYTDDSHGYKEANKKWTFFDCRGKMTDTDRDHMVPAPPLSVGGRIADFVCNHQ